MKPEAMLTACRRAWSQPAPVLVWVSLQVSSRLTLMRRRAKPLIMKDIPVIFTLTFMGCQPHPRR